MAESRYTKHHHTTIRRMIDHADDAALDSIVSTLWSYNGEHERHLPTDVLRLFRVALQATVDRSSPAMDGEDDARRGIREAYQHRVSEIDRELASRAEVKRTIDQTGTRRMAGVL